MAAFLSYFMGFPIDWGWQKQALVSDFLPLSNLLKTSISVRLGLANENFQSLTGLP
jgi:hypothetical protein